MADMSAVGKGQYNKIQQFNFRGIDDVYNAIQPLLAKHGVFCTPEVLEITRSEKLTKTGAVMTYTLMKIKYTYFAEDGSSVSCIVFGEGADSGDKSSAKAMAIAHKYSILQTFAIRTEDSRNDGDGESHIVIKPKQNTQQKAVIKQVNQSKVDQVEPEKKRVFESARVFLRQRFKNDSKRIVAYLKDNFKVERVDLLSDAQIKLMFNSLK